MGKGDSFQESTYSASLDGHEGFPCR